MKTKDSQKKPGAINREINSPENSRIKAIKIAVLMRRAPLAIGRFFLTG